MAIFKISKEEAEFIRANAKNARVTMTGAKKKSRAKRWFVDESNETFMLLDKFWKDRIKK